MALERSIDRIGETVAEIISPNLQADPFTSEMPSLDNVAWHDFSEYWHILDPDYEARPEPVVSEGATEEDLDVIADVIDGGAPPGDFLEFISKISTALGNKFREVERHNIRLIGAIDIEIFLNMKEDYGFHAHMASYNNSKVMNKVAIGAINKIFSIYCTVPESSKIKIINVVAKEFFPREGELPHECYSDVDRECLNNIQLIASLGKDVGGFPREAVTGRWEEIASIVQRCFVDDLSGECDHECLPGKPTEPYRFDTYKEGSINLGLRLLYRQEWRPLGNQRGEIVRTIPLGPKQAEKVSTKIVRRMKQSRTAEQLRSVESTTETSDTTKDSSEVVAEASEAFGWKLEAEASAEWGWGKARISGEVHGNAEKSSKDTTNRLSEAVQKSANKIRTETKVVVSTETETEFETTTSSEIFNPNDEISATYVYSRLQRQYEIFTALAEVADVVMVAERVPHPDEIDDAWIARHDWILAKALLDDSFREALGAISQEVDPPDLSGLVETLKTTLDKTTTNIKTLAGKATSVSLSQTDPTQEAQRGYREAFKEQAEAARQALLLGGKKERLKQHIRDNVLHYCRAIWSAEDSDQRLLRYRRLGIRVPTRFEFLWGDDASPRSIEELRDVIRAAGDQDLPDIRFVPTYDEATDVALSDLIRADGPVGFNGNYAIFRLKPRIDVNDLFPALNILKLPYYYEGPLQCGDDMPVPDPVDDDETGFLIDPELKRLRRNFNPGSYDPAPWTEEPTQRAMVRTLPHLRMEYEIARIEDDLAEADGKTPDAKDAFFADTEQFMRCYPDYLFRESRTSRFLIETNNLVVDIVPGLGSSLEQFKLSHRGVDVLKALEEQRRMALDNERRAALIEQKNYGDPDIEKVTVVADPSGKLGGVNLSILEDGADEK